jgi:hypothetical protein
VRLPLIGYWADDWRMGNSSNQVSTRTLVDAMRKPHSVGRRREWPEALKRQMVVETLEPGAVVSIVMLRHARLPISGRIMAMRSAWLGGYS